MSARRVLATLALSTIGPLVLWLALGAPPAWGHATIERTEPADGALLQAPPPQVLLAFTEPPDLDLTTAHVLDATGTPVEAGPPEQVPGAARELRLPVGDLPEGVYTVTWRTVSTTDGHVTAGAFSFGVGVSPQGAPAPAGSDVDGTPAPTTLAVAGRWSLVAGLVVLFGAGVAGLLALGTEVVARPRVLVGAWVLSAAGVIAMIVAERSTVGVPLGTLLGSRTGGSLVRLGVAIGVAGIATLVAVLRTDRWPLLLLAGAASAAMLVRAGGGHAGGALGPVLVHWGHLVGIGAWIGGLVWLLLGLRRGLEPARVARFSTLAAAGLGVVALTGLLRASNELGGPTWFLHAFDTRYGTTLVVKIGLVGLLVALGAANRYRNVPRLAESGPGPLRRAVGGELLVAAGVFALTGILTGLPPTGDRAPARHEPEPVVVDGTDFATTTDVSLRVSPGTVGPNSFAARITDHDSGEPVDAVRVSLRFELEGRPEVGSTLVLEPSEDRTWRAESTSLSIDGTWSVTVVVERTDGSVEIPLRVEPRAPEPRVEISRVDGQPDLYTFFLSGGVRLQAYVDPGEPGRTNQVHVTAFDAGGAELPLADGVLRAVPPAGSTIVPELLRFGPGHFVANLDLEPGSWTFEVSADARDGRTFAVSFEQTFGDR